MKSAEVVPTIVFGFVGVVVGHALACLPIAVHKAYEVGKIDDWFRAWQFFVLVLGLPGLIVIEIPTALLVYAILFKARDNRVKAYVHRIYLTTLVVATTTGVINALLSESISKGVVSSLSLALYFVCIIETARYCVTSLAK